MNLYASVAGKNISSYLTNLMGRGRLMDLTITDEAGGKADKVSLTVARDATMNPPPEQSVMIFALPDASGMLRPMGTFYSDKPKTSGSKSGGHKMSLTGTSVNMAAGWKEQRTDSYDQKTVGDIVRKIAKRQGVQPVISKALDKLKIPHKDQINVSDMQFLTSWAKDLGAFFKVREGRLLFLDKGSARNASGAALLPVKSIGIDIEDYSWTGGKRGKYKCVEAHWHDQDKATRTPEKAGSGTPKLTLKKIFPNKEEAKRAAQEALRDASVQDDKLTVTVPGNASVRAGGEYIIPPFIHKELTGSWYIAKAVHKVSKKGGYKVTMSLERKR